MSEIGETKSITAFGENAVNQTTQKDTKKVSREHTKSEAISQGKAEKQNAVNDESKIKMLREAVDGINESLKMTHTSVRMKYHEDVNRVSIKIVDDLTEEVIKEIPPEETLEMYQKMLEQAGVIVDTRG